MKKTAIIAATIIPLAAIASAYAMTNQQGLDLAHGAYIGNATDLQHLATSAKDGDANAQFWFGSYYYFAKKNYSKAKYWFSEASKQGNAKAEFQLGYLYYKGFGVKRNQKKAIMLLKEAFNNGYYSSALAIASYYSLKDENTKTKKWLKVAAQHGSKPALAMIDCLDFKNPVASNADYIHGIENLFGNSPYSTKGKCYNIKYASVYQIIGNNEALMNSEGSYFIAEFGRNNVPGIHSVVSGIAKGSGAFKYTDAGNAIKVVPLLHYLQGLYSLTNENTMSGAEQGTIDQEKQIIQMVK